MDAIKDTVIEEESGEESEEEDEDHVECIKVENSLQTEESEDVVPTDYVQAFTHFTYLYTQRQVMVCDLQGVYNYDLVPPTFELTDPAIHYRSKKGRRHVFGRTDDGEAGMDKFFHTHSCNRVCKMMQLSRRNKNWRTTWRTEQVPHRTRKSIPQTFSMEPPPSKKQRRVAVTI